ncbi:MAG: hypothetical protein MJ183_09150 [Treponemataceae bacterium]|nr:hypothetical protein [Treponemataceae bacterium]
MKRFFVFCLMFAVCFSAVSAVEVSRDELRNVTAGNETIEFINYNGPHAVINSIAEIMAIGSDLGKVVAEDTGTSADVGKENRYFVKHIVDSSEKGKLDADIFVVGSDAGVDHIVNLRRILAGYLGAAYGYDEKDSATLATFITVYNAVYRGNMAPFVAKYKSAVIAAIETENVGLSLNYTDWAGNTAIIIPLLKPVDGGLNTIDTSIISDANVINSMRDDEGRGVEDRKDMVDLKEREADEAYEAAQKAQKEAVQAAQEAKAAQKAAEEAAAQAEAAKKAAEEAQKLAEAERLKAEEAKKAAEAQPDNQKAQEEAKAAEEKAVKAEEKAEEAQKETIIAEEKAVEAQEKAEEAKEAAEEKTQEAADEQKLADKKQAEAQQERTAIANDQQKNLIEEMFASTITPVYGLVLVDETEMLSTLVQMNADSGEVIRQSPVTVIRNRTVVPLDDEYAAVAGENKGGNTAIRLVLLDNKNMEIVSQCREEVSPKSSLLKAGDYLYVVIKENDGWVLGQYNTSLKLVQKSEMKVLEATPIMETKQGIVVTDTSGSAKLLSTEDLKVIQLQE